MTLADPLPQSLPRPASAAFLAVAVLSGLAGLGYEIVWARMLALQLGHEIVAALSVITAFFAGLVLGSLTLGVRAARSPRPDRWYAALELVIGAWAVALTVLLPAVGHVVPGLLGTNPGPFLQWSVTFAIPLIVLLPATAAMGGTLPALVAMLGARGGRGAVGTAYAANTAGAVLGTMLATFVIVPALGFNGTLLLLATVNGACAFMALAALRPGQRATNAAVEAGNTLSHPTLSDRKRMVTLLASGLLGIGYEVLAIRVLGQLLENTVYTFACLLSVYLLGTAAGAAVHRRLPPGEANQILDRLLAVTACACLLGTLALFQADALAVQFRVWLPHSETGGIALELLLGAATLLLPSVGMGALFSHLGQQSVARPGGLSRAVAVNTFGAALAPVVFGVLVLPFAGAKAGLAGVALSYAVLAAIGIAKPRKLGNWAIVAAPAAAAVAIMLAPVPLSFVRVPPGGALVAEVEGVTAAVAVVRDRAGDHLLQVNSHFRQGGTASTRSDRRQAYLPLLLHPAPERALFLGLGTGVTLAAAADQPGLVADGVELVPEILPLLPLFSRAAGDLATRPGVNLHVADARRWVRATPNRYDVIMADLYFPAVDGAGALYTQEHFEAIRGRLAPGGVFCQWLPLHQLDLDTLRLIARTFLAAFPDGTAWLANFSVETPLVALVATAGPAPYDLELHRPSWFDRRVQDIGFRARLQANGLTGDLGLFGLFLADAGNLGRFAGAGPVNTDDRPLVSFRAPAAAYAMQDSPGARVAQLVALLDPQHGDVPGVQASPIAAYRQARDAFLQLGAAEASGIGRDAGASTIGRLAPALLGVVRISPDFDPAYDPLLAMAQALHRTDPPAAARLLWDLHAAAPARPQARRLLTQLSSAPGPGPRAPIR